MTCYICNSTLETTPKDYLQLPSKFCNQCKTEFSVCFCDTVCEDVIKGSREKLNYEYIVCRNCVYLGVRCTNCKRLCDIEISKSKSKHPFSLYWCCRTCEDNAFKGFVEDSLRKYVNEYREIACIDEEILCKFIFYYVDIFTFKHICRTLQYKKSLDFKKMVELLTVKHPKESIVEIIKDCQNEGSCCSTPNKNKNTSPTIYQSDLPIRPTRSFLKFFEEDDKNLLHEERIRQLESRVDTLAADLNTHKEETKNMFTEINNRFETNLLKAFENFQISNQVRIIINLF